MTDLLTSSAVRFRGCAPQFVVPDVVRAAEYYRDKFGFEIQPYVGTPPVFTIVVRGHAEIHLGKSESGECVPNARHRRLAIDAYIWVTGLDALATELASRGANILEGPVQRPYGMREMTVEDELGFRIAFGEEAPHVPHNVPEGKRSWA